MEADRDETFSPIEAVGPGFTPSHKHALSLSSPTATPSPTREERRQRSSSNPSDGAGVKHLPEHDSFTTVRLSEPPTRQLTLNTNVSTHGTIQDRRSLFATTSSPVSASVSPGVSPLSSRFSRVDPNENLSPVTSIPNSTLRPNLRDELEGLDDDSKTISGVDVEDSDDDDDDDEQVDWDTLQSKEDAESNMNEEDTTAMLLARLEQENDRLATNPKTVKVKAVEKIQTSTRKTRPPSMAQLRHMVHGPQPAPLRYSMLPPPPMTDLEFYAALVKDYQQTAARLPTLLANKIRKGIPPPLRGVVWQSMSGARDATLEDAFERYTGESSPYEGIIGKDLGRSFPGVDMFREPDGDGQRALGRVLKCYSIYDPKVGYCQGLALLVGPLLMHMSDKQAFCVLVKLMEQYDLRSSFTPDLYGLHIKFYQFRELLRENLPALSDHLEDLQVDPAAYVSQWFLSFFAVTCPLPMLFRVYDVIFAEGASETIMRVALSLMSKNMGRILALQEMEDVLQLLLSRSLWGAYNQNADEFVSDFVSLSPVVNKERLATLEQSYRESQLTDPPPATGTANAVGTTEVTSVASRFLGRLWANSTISIKAPPTTNNSSSATNSQNSNLTPGAASRPMSMLQRTASKQSLASTLNSMEASNTNSTSSAASVLSTASTDATSFTRDSAAESALGRESKAALLQSQNADSQQIEDLLIALSDLQRQHALLSDQLQKEREEREEDRRAVNHLLGGIRRQASSDTVVTAHSADSDATIKADGIELAAVSDLLDMVEGRFGNEGDKRRSSIIQTKPQLRDDLARTKEQLDIEISKSQDANRRAVDLEQEIANIKEQLRESHAHVRNLHTEKQRLEKQIRTMRVRASDITGNDSGGTGPGGWLSRNPSTKSNASIGLRELKLGRSQSTPSGIITMNKRTSSLLGPSGEETPPPPPPPPISEPQPSPPPSEHEALLLELIQAKTSEAMARQEADEAKQKLEQLRKSLGIPSDHQSGLQAPGQPGVMGMLRSFTSPAAEQAAAAAAKNAPAAKPTAKPAAKPAAPATPTPAPAAGGFWGWGKK